MIQLLQILQINIDNRSIICISQFNRRLLLFKELYIFISYTLIIFLQRYDTH